MVCVYWLPGKVPLHCIFYFLYVITDHPIPRTNNFYIFWFRFDLVVLHHLQPCWELLLCFFSPSAPKNTKEPGNFKKKTQNFAKMHPETVTLTRRLCKKHKRTRRLCKNASRKRHTNPETLQKNTKEPGDFAKMHPESVTLTRRFWDFAAKMHPETVTLARRLCKKTQKNPETLQKCITKTSD